MTAMNRSFFPKQLVPGLNAIFGLEYGLVDNEHAPLFQTENSERAFEEEVYMSMFGSAPVKDEGDSVRYDSARELWTSRYTHETIALAFALTEEAVEDNLYASIAKIRAKGLARAMANTKQIKAADIFNNGFNSAFAGGDGQSLFSTAHPTVEAGSLSNRVAQDLSESALESAIINISLLKDDRDILMGAAAKSLHIPPHLQFTADRLLKSTLRPGTADNDVNALNMRGLLGGGYAINRRFTDTNAWFIKTDVPNSTKMFVRMKLQTKDEGDFDTGNWRYKARERYSFGWSDWRGWYGSAGAT